MKTFGLIVLGGGPAGYTAAEKAAKGGLSVLLLEKNKLGGVCLNEGCIPTKTLLHCAKVYTMAKNGGDFGVTAENAVLDHKAVLARKNKTVKRLSLGIAAGLKAAGVTVVYEEGKIIGKDGNNFVVETNTDRFSADNLLIASGSYAYLPNIEGLSDSVKNGTALTSREILDIEEIPKRLTVIGGGAVGLETASYFSAAGSEVTVVEMLNNIASGTEAEISGILKKCLEKKGIRFLLGARAVSVDGANLVCEKDGERILIEGDKIMFAAGRKSNATGLGLETLGVKIVRGAVETNASAETNVKGVYAAGDITGKKMLAHTAVREAEAAVNNMLGVNDAVNYNAVPSVIYTSPEVAWVGETEESAVSKGYAVRCARLPLTYSGRFVAEAKELDGMIKIIAEQDAILGVHIIGSYASEIIAQAAALIDLGVSVERSKRLIFPHPTVSEIIKEALKAL